ncbi:uncharacterized protein LOC8269108 [Ricinus communis]|uniref:Uncharacterized protein n=1 Tax=Ricinus communis TaxID=3988 RepID=B9RVR9_RICCO|nr:uncharacterized protein LOC8269108 [Ricinus communis]EEF44356.1 conserved hypothetical protein [Ricinus communis]|eukprot:XP_002517838.1 uncharacterized protein LOC8269108 [Ricinus communis]
MARTNKYTSINFNHVYDKNLTTNNKNSASNTDPSKQPSGLYSTVSSPNTYKNHLSSSSSSSSRSHGRMLVLTRPTPKPISNIATTPPLSPSPQIKSTQSPDIQDQDRSEPDSNLISLRPSGRTGSSLCVSAQIQIPEKEVGAGKFVPPHLRPGFVGREERPGPEVVRGKDAAHRQQPQGYSGYGSGSPVQYGEDGRPKSGGGYDRMTRGGESDLNFINRPRSSGNRPNSSG